MSKRLNFFVDAGKNKNTFGIGIMAFYNGREILCISKTIPDKMNITDISNAELYAIVFALQEIHKAKVSNIEIYIHTDSTAALMTASGNRFKSCLDKLYGQLRTYTGQLKKIFGNTLLFAKIDSEYNHGKAHDLATDASNGKEYRIGELILSDNISEEVAITAEDSTISAQTENVTPSSNSDLLFNGINISQLFKDYEIQFKESLDTLQEKEEEVKTLKEHIQTLKFDIDEISKENVLLSQDNNSKYSELNSLSSIKDYKEDVLKKLNNKISSQNTSIKTITTDIAKLEEHFKHEKMENDIKIKFLKQEFEQAILEKYHLDIIIEEKLGISTKKVLM